MDISDFMVRSLVNNTEEIEGLLRQNKYLSSEFEYDPVLPALAPRENEVKRIFDLFKENGFCKVLTRRENIVGVLIADRSRFDSDLFGFGVGKIKHMSVSDGLFDEEALFARRVLVQECVSWMKQNRVECVVARVDPRERSVFEENDFRLADVLSTFHLSADLMKSTQELSSSDIVIRPSCSEDETKLMDISRKAFLHDHFHKDANFPKKRSDDLFARWIYNCCHGRADVVLVANDHNKKPAGFVACKIEIAGKSKRGIIDLIAVSPSYRRKGIGESLVRKAVQWFAGNDAQSVFVGTQADNLAAVRTYEKNRFRLVRTRLTFHKWVNT
jgi:ribosomal protein S18 acetylase RimI-like enzyme